MNIAKIHKQYPWDVRSWCSEKKEGIFLSVDLSKKKNQHGTLYLEGQVVWSIPMEFVSWLSEIE